MSKLRFSLKTMAFLVCTLAFCSIVKAQAQRTFVSGTGVDNLSCSLASPCRTFQAAVNAVGAGGEVVAKDSGDFGPVVIAKSVTITGEGVDASILAPSSGAGVAITASSGDVVHLRSIRIQGMGVASSGVSLISTAPGISGNPAAGLHLENVTITACGEGISANIVGSAGAFYLLTLKDTIVKDGSGVGGVFGATNGTLQVSMYRCRFNRNTGGGVHAQANSKITAQRTIAASNGGAGFSASGNSSTTKGEINLDRCVATNNDIGVRANTHSLIRIAECFITNNGTGVFTLTGANAGQILSRSSAGGPTNTIEGNGPIDVNGNGTVDVSGVALGTYSAK